MIKQYRDACNCLKVQSELELAYLSGVALKEMPSVNQRKRRFPGFLNAMASSIILMIRLYFRRSNSVTSEILYFYNTHNQRDALKPIIKSSENKSFSYEELSVIIGPRKVSLSTASLIVALALILTKGISLYYSFITKHEKSGKIDFLNEYFATYVFLVLFSELLDSSRTKIVMMANDHNIENKCLKVVCESLGIKTAYVQHASVSPVFPPLTFDYSFLDGIVSYETYQQSIFNSPITMEHEGKVFLSGMVKFQKPILNKKPPIVGIALSHLDDLRKVNVIIRQLIECNIDYKVRLHPIQGLDVEEKLLSTNFSRNESVAEYLDSIAFMIAGDSGIHLEGALRGVKTYYYKMSDLIRYDYYGFVGNKLSIELTESDLSNFSLAFFAEPVNRLLAEQKYSASFGTKWQFREAELISRTLSELLNRDNISLFEKNMSLYTINEKQLAP